MNGIKRRYENWTKQLRNKTFGTWGKFNNNIERENLKRSTCWAMEESKAVFVHVQSEKAHLVAISTIFVAWSSIPYTFFSRRRQPDVTLCLLETQDLLEKNNLLFWRPFKGLTKSNGERISTFGVGKWFFSFGKACFQGGELGFGQDYPRKLTWQWKNNHEWRCISHQK